MTNRDSTDFLDDILEYIDRIERFTDGLSFDEFKSDERTICAVVNCIEVIGEATKHIPESTKSKYPEIPWKDMAGIRDRIIHGYLKSILKSYGKRQLRSFLKSSR